MNRHRSMLGAALSAAIGFLPPPQAGIQLGTAAMTTRNAKRLERKSDRARGPRVHRHQNR